MLDILQTIIGNTVGKEQPEDDIIFLHDVEIGSLTGTLKELCNTKFYGTLAYTLDGEYCALGVMGSNGPPEFIPQIQSRKRNAKHVLKFSTLYRQEALFRWRPATEQEAALTAI